MPGITNPIFVANGIIRNLISTQCAIVSVLLVYDIIKSFFASRWPPKVTEIESIVEEKRWLEAEFIGCSVSQSLISKIMIFVFAMKCQFPVIW